MLGIQTEPISDSPLNPAEPWQGEYCGRAKHHDNFRYGTIGYRNIRKLLRLMPPKPEDVFYDLGCGMGRVLCLVARQQVRKCVGVELLEPLCQIARRNAMNLRGRRSPISVVCEDATAADLSGGTIYFLFNPFGPETLRDVLKNLRQSIRQNPRTVKIVYYHSKHKAVVETLDWLVKTQDFDNFGGHPVTIWEARPSA